MKDERRFIKNNRNLLILLSVISVLLTVYSMPAGHKENYTFTVGKPWTYNVLIAPFNFSVEKSDEAWQAEADSVKASFAPYFTRNASVQEAALAQFDRFYADSLSKLVWEESYQALRTRLKKVYQDGIISTSDEDLLAGKPLFRIYEGNTSSFVQTSAVKSIRDAYRYVTEASVYNYDRYILLQHNLEEFIQPNVIYDAARSSCPYAMGDIIICFHAFFITTSTGSPAESSTPNVSFPPRFVLITPADAPFTITS